MESIVEINAFDQEVNKWKTDLTLATKPNVIYTLKWGEVKVAQSYPTLCDPMDYTIHGILQFRILEWVAIPFSRGIFPTQGLNPGLPRCRQIPYRLSHHRR